MGDGDRADPTFFFVHVMKTGGTTFVQHFEAQFTPEQIYPPPERGAVHQRKYYMIDELRALSAQQRATFRAYGGHFPFAATRIVEPDVTLTILRDPVERTVSYLRHCKRHHEDQARKPLEEIYDDPWYFALCMRDYQAKQFSMTPADKLESHLDELIVDGPRLAEAKRQVAEVDVLGFSDRYDDFVAEVQTRYGWRIEPAKNLRVSKEGWDVSPSFRRRIADDLEADMEFYAYARDLHAHRRATADAS